MSSYDDLPTYPLIRLWGAMLGSYRHYITEQVRIAQLEGAPQHAIYRTCRRPLADDGEGRYFRADGADGAWALWVPDIPHETRDLILGGAKRAGMDVDRVIAVMALGQGAASRRD